MHERVGVIKLLFLYFILLETLCKLNKDRTGKERRHVPDHTEARTDSGPKASSSSASGLGRLHLRFLRHLCGCLFSADPDPADVESRI